MDGTQEMLRRMEGQVVEAVALRLDGLVFQMEEGALVCIRLPSVKVDGAELPVRSGAWFQALWDCVGETPTRVTLDGARLSFLLGGREVAIDCGAPDHDDPESALLFLDGQLAVF